MDELGTHRNAANRRLDSFSTVRRRSFDVKTVLISFFQKQVFHITHAVHLNLKQLSGFLTARSEQPHRYARTTLAGLSYSEFDYGDLDQPSFRTAAVPHSLFWKLATGRA